MAPASRVQDSGSGRLETIREQEGGKGYAAGFEGLIGFIDGLLPTNEVIEQALRRTVPMFPQLAVRELVADQNSAEASRLLKEALTEGMIAIEDPSVWTRSRSYVPFWAAPGYSSQEGFA